MNNWLLEGGLGSRLDIRNTSKLKRPLIQHRILHRPGSILRAQLSISHRIVRRRDMLCVWPVSGPQSFYFISVTPS